MRAYNRAMQQIENATQGVLLYPRSIETLASALRTLKKKHSLSHLTLLVVAQRQDSIDYSALQSILDLEFPQEKNEIVTIPLKGIMQKSWSTLKRHIAFEPMPVTNDENRKNKMRVITLHQSSLIQHLATKLERSLLEIYCLHMGKVGFVAKVSQSAAAKTELEIIEL